MSSITDHALPHHALTLATGELQALPVFRSGSRALLIFIVLSVLAHATALIEFGGDWLNPHNERALSSPLEIILQTAPAEQPPTTEIAEPKPDVSPPPPAPEPPPPEPEVVHTQQAAAPTPARVVQTTPVPPIMETRADEDELTETEPQAQSTAQPQSAPTPAAADAAFLESVRQQYLQQIAALLEQHKFYPRSARRRHIEGEVEVSFELLANGDIRGLRIRDGHRSLQQAVRASVESALPFPPLPQSMHSIDHLPIHYVMRFALED